MNLEEFKLVELLSHIKRSNPSSNLLFDPVRKIWIKENPEELVRQCLIIWLRTQSIPYSRMAIEKQIQVFGLKKRFDLVIYDRSASPFILVECKSPQISIRQNMFDQAAVYNIKLQAPYLGICNGHEFKICEINFEQKIFRFIYSLPNYPF